MIPVENIFKIFLKNFKNKTRNTIWSPESGGSFGADARIPVAYYGFVSTHTKLGSATDFCPWKNSGVTV